MGQLNLSQIQLGDSATASNNFVLKIPTVPNGTLVIANGNIGSETDVATIDSAGNIVANGVALTGIVSGTSVSASGTSVDFTGIPSWAKRITVMLNDVSTNGTSSLQVQLGAGSVTTSGYSSAAGSIVSSMCGAVLYTSGLVCGTNISAATTSKGSVIITNVTSNTWVSQGVLYTRADTVSMSSGEIALGGTLDRVRITTVNGTDTFDAGTVNILWE